MNRKAIIRILVFSLIFFSLSAHADVAGTNILDDIQAIYKTAASAWVGAIKAKATFLFWTLATISMVWTFGMLHLKNAGHGEFFGEFVRFSVFTGFFKWLLDNGPQMPVDIINSMMILGGSATGSTGAITPSSIVNIGFQLISTAITKSSVWSPVDSVVGLFVTLIILIALTLIGVNMLILLISAWVMSYAGIFVLGFGGSRWTSDIAISYYKTVLSIGLQTLAMILLVGVGQTFINDYYSRIGNGFQFQDVFVLLVAAIVLLQLTNKIPSLIGGLVMGGGTHALGQGFGASHAMAAMGAAAAAFTAGVEMLKSGGANAIGGAQALQAAFAKQAEYEAAGVGGSSSMQLAPDYNSGSGNGGSSGGKSQAAQNSPFSDFMGHTNSSSPSSSLAGTNAQSASSKNSGQGKFGGSVVSTLAKGAVSVIGDKIQSRVDQSAAGQLTAAIKNMGTPTQAEPAFGENSLSGPTTDPTSATGVTSAASSGNDTSYADEVAAFVNGRTYDE